MKNKINKILIHSDVIKGIVFDAGSLVIPYMEDFMVKELSKIKSKIKDQDVLNEYNKLFEEEFAHAKVHHAYNSLLIREGYSFDLYVKFVSLLFKIIGYMPSSFKIAFLSAAEHFTNCLSFAEIEHNSIEKGLNPKIAKLWKWHFYEEADHRDCFFNIYNYLFGGYILRAFTFLLAFPMFVINNIISTSILMFQHGYFFKINAHKEIFKLSLQPFGYIKNIPKFFLYLKPSFHPSQLKYNQDYLKDIHRYSIENDLIDMLNNAN